MKLISKHSLIGVCGLALLVAAYAGNNVFTATGPTEANTCERAASDAAKWVRNNALQFNLNKQQPSTSDCSCRGNDKDGWACQVTISY